jgi:hypothetical protein
MIHTKTLKTALYSLLLAGITLQASASPNAIQDKHRDLATAIQKIILQQQSLKKLENTFFHPIDAIQYGVPIRNPFNKVPPHITKAMLAGGIDLLAMARYRAIYVGGMLAGASARKLINSDPRTVLVIGNGTIAHDMVYSRGPVVLLGDAELSAGIYGESLVWYSDKASFRNDTYTRHIGLPSVMRGSNPNHSFGTSLYSPQEEQAAAAALSRKVK